MCEKCAGGHVQQVQALNFFSGECGRQLRATINDIVEDVVRDQGQRVVDAAFDFARCSVGLPTKDAVQYFVQSVGNAKHPQVQMAAAYVNFKPPVACTALALEALLSGKGLREAVMAVAACIAADLLKQFGDLVSVVATPGTNTGGTNTGGTNTGGIPDTVTVPRPR